jgi:hypothetical protein
LHFCDAVAKVAASTKTAREAILRGRFFFFPKGALTMHDEEFLRQFADGTLEPFHHTDHVKMAWLYLQRFPVLAAIAQFTSDLKHFAAAKGSPNLYHETITWAYLLLIHERMQLHAAEDWETFAAQNPDLLTWERSVLRRYYRAATLQSELARRVFVFPDNCVTEV